MPETTTSACGAYVCSKAGLWKLVVLISGCATFAIYADSEMYLGSRLKTFILASFIISWGISLLLYFFRVTGLYIHMNSTCMSFDSFDYFWAWISCVNFLSMSVVLACFFSNCDPGCSGHRGYCNCAKQLTTVFLGVLTAVFYVLEAQNLRLYAPVGTGYGTSWRGLWRMFILVVGGCAFGLLIETGYVCRRSAKTGCDSARLFVLIVWCTAWGFSCLLYLFHICNFSSKVSVEGKVRFGAIEFFWAAFSCLLFLVGACVFAGFLNCDRFETYACRARLAGDICGFVAAILFGIDAYQLRNRRPIWLFGATPAPSRR
uniref:Myeloid-associated differentiation marker-like protein 2 n=1 Tax=Phallusia mammillata TaxID=59560 RepID=A0A6F9DME9_9ASCI|nr:myeloid-associated differentiation marker-like protein 2 [Phallusia mammillata]